jgi:sugar/nucleoside kinase (ribokinase family)
MPRNGKRAIVRCRDDDYLGSFPVLDLTGCCALHIDGHQPDAAIHYARNCRAAGILTSLDGGGLRSNTHESARLNRCGGCCGTALRTDGAHTFRDVGLLKGARLPCRGVPLGERGLLWYDEKDTIRSFSALPVASHRIIDTSGAGDVFHGAYYLLGTSTFASLGQQRRIRSSTSETRRACRCRH